MSEPTLETPRLRLRQFREDDLDAWARITSDPEVMRYVGGSALTREDAWRSLGYLLGHWKIRGFGLCFKDSAPRRQDWFSLDLTTC